MSEPSLSVVIPTYGDAPCLRDVLASLCNQSKEVFEILVVDNNEVPRVHGLCELFGPRVKFLHCPQQGLSAARNAGIAATRGEYVAFLDDDSVPDRTWAGELLCGLRRHECAAAGGRVELAIQGRLPAWFPDRLRSLLSELRYEGVDIPALTDLQYVVGANFCVSRRTVEALGGFRLDLGRNGACMLSSEEIELCKRIRKYGGRVAFFAAPVVWHQIPRRRYTLRNVLKRSIWQGRSDARVEMLHGRPAVLDQRSNILHMLAFGYRRLLMCRNRSGAVGAAADLIRQGGYLMEYVKQGSQARWRRRRN